MVRFFVAPASRLTEVDSSPFRLSVVIDVPPDRVRLGKRTEAVEGRGDPRQLAEFGRETYVEVALDDELEDRLAAIRAAKAYAKVRCGPESPTIDELGRFVRLCRAGGVPFKATAGLHHAVRTDGQHGFLNLLAASVFGDEERALAEDDAGALSVGAGFSWRDRRASANEIRQARVTTLRAIGSCSFTEPVDELKTLGML